MIVFACPNCTQKLQIGYEHAGRKIRCPKCRAAVPVPRPAESPDEDEDAEIAVAEEPSQPEKHSPRAEPAVERPPRKNAGRGTDEVRTSRWPIVAGLLAFLVLIGGAAAVGYYFNFRTNTDQPVANGHPKAPDAKADHKPVLAVSVGQEVMGSIACSADGRWLATGGWDKTVRLWDVATGREVRVIAGYKSPVDCVAISSDNKWLFSANYEVGQLHELSSGKEIHVLKGHREAIRAAVFSRDGKWLVTCSGEDRYRGQIPDSTARLWNVETGKQVHVIRGHTSGVTSVAITRDSKFLVTGSADGSARLWKLETGELIREVGRHANAVFAVTISPDGQWLVTSSADRTAQFWEIATGKKGRTLTEKVSVFTAAFSKDGKTLVTAANDAFSGGSVRFWNTETGNELDTMKNAVSGGRVFTVFYTDDGKWLITGDARTVRLREADTGKEVRLFENRVMQNNFTGFNSDRKWMVSAFYNFHWTWDLTTGKRASEFVSKDFSDATAMTPDGKWTWSGSQLFDSTTGKQVRVFPNAQCAGFSRDMQTLVTGSEDRTATVWKLPDFQEVRVIEGKLGKWKGPDRDPRGARMVDGGSITSVSLSANGRAALGRQHGGMVDVYDLSTGKLQRTFTLAGKRVRAAVLSGDGKLLLTDTSESTTDENPAVELWNVADGARIRAFPDVADDKEKRGFGTRRTPTGPSAISHDFKWLVTEGKDSTIILWEMDTGKEVRTFKGHLDRIFSVALTGDGKRVVSSGSDGTRIWDAGSGKELCRLHCFGKGGWAVFDADGRFDASNLDDVDGMHWVVGDETFPLGKFKQDFHDPGLLGKYLGVIAEPLRAIAGQQPKPPEKDASAKSPPEKAPAKERPKPLSAELRKAWNNAGAEDNWMFWTFPDEVPETSRSHESEGLLGEVPLFYFRDLSKWRRGDFAKLPSPGQPFWVYLNQLYIPDGMLKDIGEQEHLRGLYLFESEFTDVKLKELAGIKQLRWLSLKNTRVTDQGLKELAANKQLQWLDLQFTKITDAGVRDLAQLTELRWLYLAGTAVTDATLKDLARLKNLQTLSVPYTKVTDPGMKNLAGLPYLQSLNISGTEVGDAGLRDLVSLKHLQRLDLDSTKITDAGLKHLAPLTKLQRLDLSHTRVTDVGLKELAGLTQLSELRLGNTAITDTGLKELTHLKKLSLIQLTGTRITGAGLAELKDAFPDAHIFR